MTDAVADVTHEVSVPRAAAVAHSRVMLALIQRELWEHRALWIVPTVTCVLLVLSATITRVSPGGYNQMPFGPFDWHTSGTVVSGEYTAGVALASIRQWLLSVPLYLSAGVMLFFYVLSCLYDERKDRSILFWKSLPVSDAATVLSKVLVATVVVPLGIFFVAIVAHLLYTAVWDIRHAMGLVGGPPFIWDTGAWLKVEGLMFTFLVLACLWYTPVVAYLILVSAWARRNPFLWAVLPPLILAVVERVAFGTTYLTHAFLGRLLGVFAAVAMNPETGSAFNAAILNTPYGKIVSLPKVFDLIDFHRLFLDPELWIGIAIAAVFLYGAIRLRRYRDDT